MLRADHLAKSYGITLLFEGVSFVLNAGERAGLVGINGSGKSTLLRLLACLEEPDEGSVFLSRGETVGYLPQSMEHLHGQTLRAILESARGDLPLIRERIRLLESEMARVNTEMNQALLKQYGELVAEFEARGGYVLEHRVEMVTQGLELGEIDLDRTLESLSGGQKIKLALARLLLENPSILLLDEPTNNLDLPALLWLENYLKSYKGAIIVVSHDRKFLDRVVAQVIELDEFKKTTTMYRGNFSEYSRQKMIELHSWEQSYKQQQRWIQKVEQDIQRTKHQAQGSESATNDSKIRRYAKKVAKKAKAREKRLERVLEGEARVDKPPLEWGLKLDLTGSIPANAGVLRAENIHWSYAGRELLQGVSLEIKGRDRVVIVGRNGSGKTTLLKILMGELIPLRGNVWVGPDVRVGYFSQEHSELDLRKTVLEEFRQDVVMYEDEARQFLSYFLFFEDEVTKRVRDISLGERAKLALAKMVVGGANFLVLDEPTNHMDFRSLEVVESALAQFQGSILLVSHDRYFIDRVHVNKVYSLEDGELIYRAGGYEEYEREILFGRG